MMNMESRIKLPQGFRFNPFEKELITFYLKPKVLGEKLPCNVVEERQLYGPNANPWQVFDSKNHPWIEHEVSSGKFEKVAYVFVNLTAVKKNNGGGREQFIKKAGCGCWDGQTSRSEIRDSNGNLIGEKRMLVFEINQVSDQDDFSRVGYWRMHEYNLCGVNQNIPNNSNTVLCKITLDSSKNPPIKLRPTTAKPQIKNNKNKNTKNVVVVNVCSPSTVNSDVVDADVGGISENCGGEAATQTCHDDALDLIDRPKGEEELCYQSDVVETCDDVEWINSIYDNSSIYDEEDGLGGIGSSLLGKVDTGPVSFEAKHDNGYQIPVREQGQGENLYMTKFEFPRYEFDFTSYFEPNYEQLLEDFNTNMGKRKLDSETSYAMELSTLHHLKLIKEQFFKKLEFSMTLV